MKFFIYSIFSMSISINIDSYGQTQTSSNEKNNLSITDSLNFKRFIDSVGKCPLFSINRQNYLDSLLMIKNHDPNIWQQKAMPLFKQRKYELGLPYLDSAVKYDDRFHHFLEYRAFMKCIFQKNYRESIVDFKQVLNVNGNQHSIMDHPYKFYLGLCYLQLNKFDSAEYYMQSVINDELKGRNDELTHYMHWFYLGIIKKEKEQLDSASLCFEKCLKSYSQLPDAIYYNAYCKKQPIGGAEFMKQLELSFNYSNKGYSINEDNAIYEPYPYQISKHQLEATIQYYKSNKD